MKVLVDGAFWSPYASEGRWAWNTCRLLAKMNVELCLYIPNPAWDHAYFRDFNPLNWFPKARLVYPGTTEEFDVMITIQGNDPRPGIIAKKRIASIFEGYWYGNQFESFGFPRDTTWCYAIQPYKQEYPHNNWPDRKLSLLPYSPYYEPTSNNFKNKGILLTMKDPTSPEVTEETALARINHLMAALHFLERGIKVSVAMGHRLDVTQNPKNTDIVTDALNELAELGATFYNKQPPHLMEKLIREHSVIYTGKVGNSILYAAFQDALCLGSFPLIWTDWPEQFFRDPNLFEPYRGMGHLIDRTSRLLEDQEVYSQELEKLRSNIDLYTEEQGIEILKGLIG